jgi:2-dehydro-3-deoxygluconokinase
MTYHIVTLGETMLRLTPPDFQRLEQATSLQVHVGGSESNTAIGLARLGMRVAWLSRLTDNPVGRLVASAIRAHGVDTSHVVWTPEDRIGTYYLEEGGSPRGSRVLYDRANSAMANIQPEDLPVDLFQSDHGSLLHLTGITVGLSESAAQTAYYAAELAEQAGWGISFDLNYRSRLWLPDTARTKCTPLIEAADILFVPFRDACQLFGFSDTTPPEAVMRQLSQRFPQTLIVMSNDADGVYARAVNGLVEHQPAFEVDTVGRVGAGDAFNAGFLAQYIASNDLEAALAWGNAAAALKFSIPGDMPIMDRSDIEGVLSGSSMRVKR